MPIECWKKKENPLFPYNCRLYQNFMNFLREVNAKKPISFSSWCAGERKTEFSNETPVFGAGIWYLLTRRVLTASKNFPFARQKRNLFERMGFIERFKWKVWNYFSKKKFGSVVVNIPKTGGLFFFRKDKGEFCFAN